MQSNYSRLFSQYLCYCFGFFLLFAFPCITFANEGMNIPILCYHNLNPVKPGSMNLTPKKFEAQIKLIKDNGFTIIPLKDAVAYLQGKRASLPAKPIVISFDDGWESAYTYLFPIVRKYQFPVTLFIYPGTISEGKNAMTWTQLKELQQTGLFDIEGHTFWHPNFKHEKRRLSPAAYDRFVQYELGQSKQVLQEKMGKEITLLAWPFGIYDDYLEKQAANAGYEMAFSIDAKTANKNYRAMSQPRFMIIDGQSMKTFAGIVNSGNRRNIMSAGRED